MVADASGTAPIACAQAAQLLHQRHGGGRRSGIVAQHRGPDQDAAGVQADQPLLLRGDADRGDPLQQPALGSGPERTQPRLRIDLGGRGSGRDAGVRGTVLPQHGTGLGVADGDLRELG
jgi:hypothetical protein